MYICPKCENSNQNTIEIFNPIDVYVQSNVTKCKCNKCGFVGKISVFEVSDLEWKERVME